jgi:hypothetical protein
VSARGAALGGDVFDAADGPALADGGAAEPTHGTQLRMMHARYIVLHARMLHAHGADIGMLH